MRSYRALILLSLISVPHISNGAEDDSRSLWSEFRGPNGFGVVSDAHLPERLSETRPHWTAPLPPGHSSPVLTDTLVVVTAEDNDRLVTIALDRRTGERRWVRAAPGEADEKVHQAGSRAASTPCTDARHIYVYFGSFGLLCYDHAGEEIWRRPLATPKSLYGMACSPILFAGQLIMVLDDDADLPESSVSRSRVVAFRCSDGELLWETSRPFHRSSWSTPTVDRSADPPELIVSGNGRVRSYRADTGEELWSVGGFSRETIHRPILGDGIVLVSASMIGGVADEQPDTEPFWNAVLRFDADGDGKLGREEIDENFTMPFRPDLPPGHPGFGMPLPSNPEKRRARQTAIFNGIDSDRDGTWTQDEFVRHLNFNRGKPNLLAVRPGGRGDVGETHVAWALHRGIPEIPTPVLSDGRIWMIGDGGLLTCTDARDGRTLVRKRLRAGGHYRASPIIAGDRLCVISAAGRMTLVRADETAEVSDELDLEAEVAATPALSEDALYVRTNDRLIAYQTDGNDPVSQD